MRNIFIISTFKLFLGYQFVTNGCLNKFPGEITSREESELHAVRCCDEDGSTCISPKPCNLEATFEEAQSICSNEGLQLCPINTQLPETCCGTGCDIDPVTMWLRDIRQSSGFPQISIKQKTSISQGKFDHSKQFFNDFALMKMKNKI